MLLTYFFFFFEKYMIAMSVVCPGYSSLFTQLSDARQITVKQADTRRWIREYGKEERRGQMRKKRSEGESSFFAGKLEEFSGKRLYVDVSKNFSLFHKKKKIRKKSSCYLFSNHISLFLVFPFLRFSFFFFLQVDCWENCLSSAPCPQSLVGMPFTDVALVTR